MTNDYRSQPLTGKSKRKQIQPVSEELMLPVIKKEEVSKKSNVINDATKSGKQKGAMVCLEGAVVYWRLLSRLMAKKIQSGS